MKNLFKTIALFFKPTEEFKGALKNVKAGDILYLSQGAIPNKEIAGYQLVTSVENNHVCITWGENGLAMLKKIRSKLVNENFTPKLIYWESLDFDLKTGYVKDHGDLKVTEIIKDKDVSIRIYPSMALYYISMYSITLFVLAALIALCFVLAILIF